MQPNYSEFSDPLLVAIYNTVCPLDGYEKFYLDLAKKLSAKTIVDIGCGSGLLTCELAKQGHHMIGVEPAYAMLDLARQSTCGEQVSWISGDALSLGEFNADLAIMTGHVAQFYLEDEYWLKALKSIHKSLRPGGYLAFESRNPAIQPWINNKGHIDWPSKLSPRTVNDPKEGEIKWWVELLEVRGEQVFTEIHYQFSKTGKELISVNELRYRTQEEISQSLEDAGFSVENVFGNWDKAPVSLESPEFIFIARRRGL